MTNPFLATIDLLPLTLVAAIASGLLAGALLTEACVLVPYWKRMNPVDFLTLHPALSPLLFRFYAPITVVGTLLPVVVCATQWGVDASTTWLWTISAACSIILLGFYFGFFRQANIQFAQSQSPSDAATSLTKWARMHQARTGVAIIGFAFAGLALAAA